MDGQLLQDWKLVSPSAGADDVRPLLALLAGAGVGTGRLCVAGTDLALALQRKVLQGLLSELRW